jgi:hypothetical protein
MCIHLFVHSNSFVTNFPFVIKWYHCFPGEYLPNGTSFRTNPCASWELIRYAV